MVSFQNEFCLYYGLLPVIPYKQRAFTFHNHNFDFHRAKSWKINIFAFFIMIIMIIIIIAVIITTRSKLLLFSVFLDFYTEVIMESRCSILNLKKLIISQITHKWLQNNHFAGYFQSFHKNDDTVT